MPDENFGIVEHLVELTHQGIRHHHGKTCCSPQRNETCWRPSGVDGGTDQHIGIQHGADHAPCRVACWRTACTASAISCSITSEGTSALRACTASIIAKNCSRCCCHSSNCQTGTTAAMGLPARSIM